MRRPCCASTATTSLDGHEEGAMILQGSASEWVIFVTATGETHRLDDFVEDDAGADQLVDAMVEAGTATRH